MTLLTEPDTDTHRHTYRRDITEWWCWTCDTRTDHCEELHP